MASNQLITMFRRAFPTIESGDPQTAIQQMPLEPATNCVTLEDRLLLSASPLPLLATAVNEALLEADWDADCDTDCPGDFENVFGFGDLDLERLLETDRGGLDDEGVENNGLTKSDDALSAVDAKPISSPALITNNESDQLVIIDAGVDDTDQLIADLKSQVEAGNLWIELLEGEQDGIQRISEILDRYENLDSIHLVSHGEQGSVRLGNTSLTNDSLETYVEQISGWANSLDQDADLLFYGCDVAGSVEGTQLIDSIAQLTGADVAASTDITGHRTVAGNWLLEYAAGDLESDVVFSYDVQAEWQHSLQTFTVTSTADTDTAGTLRRAILDANQTAGLDTIEFEIGGGGPQTITLVSDLPVISETVIIDGTTQDGYTMVPLVTIDGNGNAEVILDVATNEVTIQGLVIGGAAGSSSDDAAVRLTGDNNTLAENYLGIDQTGTSPLGNKQHGVLVDGNGNMIRNNVISGNDEDGIHVNDGSGTQILDNFIGTNGAGSAGVGNGNYGIAMQGSGSATLTENIVSGNGAHGIQIESNSNLIADNYVGLDAEGEFAIQNDDDGIHIHGELNTIETNVASGNGQNGISIHTGNGVNTISGNFVGTNVDGTATVGNLRNGILVQIDGQTIEDNLVSGNTDEGIELNSDDNLVVRNYVGTDVTGTFNLGNGDNGILINGQHNVIGGSTSSGGNLIAFNGGSGIKMRAGADANNVFFSNSIHDNDGLGIDLVGGDETTIGSGVTANSDDDGLQNFPVLTVGHYDGSTLSVEGWATSSVAATHRVDLYVTYNPDSVGYGEGMFLTSGLITSDSSGDLPFGGVVTDVTLHEGAYLTTTLTRLTDSFSGSSTTTGHTSEFSQAIAVTFDVPTIDLDADDSVSPGSDFESVVTDTSTPVAITDSDAVVSSSTGELASVNVVITNLLDSGNELLTADTTGTTISASYVPTTGELVLSGTDTVANYNRVIRSITYENTASNPDRTTRLITFQAHENGASNLATSSVTFVGHNLSGSVYVDANGDGDFRDDGIAATGVEVLLYRDGGDGLANGADDTLIRSTTTADGAYDFNSTMDGVYWVVVDSRTIGADVDLNSGFDDGDIWAEQTFGSAGAFAADRLGGTTLLTTSGAAFGGRRAGISDDATSLSSSEHVTQVIIDGSDVGQVDSAFSFNVVTTTAGGDGQDDDPNNGRTMQGTLRQYIVNANGISGGNTMRFVPVDPTNASFASTSWWEVNVSVALPAITDELTVIDGTAYDSATNAVLNPNSGRLGFVGDVGIDPHGSDQTAGTTDDVGLAGVNAPELEIRGATQADGTAAVDIGIEILGSQVELHGLSIHGFGSATDDDSGNLVVGSDDVATDMANIHDNVIGSAPSNETTETQGTNILVRSSSNGRIENNLIRDAGSWGIQLLGTVGSSNSWDIVGNEIRNSGQTPSQGDPGTGGGILISSSASADVYGNLIVENQGNGISTRYSGGQNKIEWNTISDNGTESDAGVVLFGSRNQVAGNVITDNAGAGVVVTGRVVGEWNASTQNTISKNTFGGNGGLAIDLVATTDATTAVEGDGISLNNGTSNDTTGNQGADAPVLNVVQVTSDDSMVASVSSMPSNVKYLELYLLGADSNDSIGGVQFGEGTTHLATYSIAGSATTIEFDSGITPSADEQVTAIAILNNGNTSEFSGAVEVNYAPDATDDAVTIDANENFTAVLGTSDVLTNDTDLDNDTLTVNTTPITGPSAGTLSLNVDGTFTYVPDFGFSGEDSFTYEVLDGQGGKSEATVTVTVLPNTNPITSDDLYELHEDTPMSVSLPLDGLLSNDTDPEEQSLTVNTTPVIGPSTGSLALRPDGTFSYAPEANFAGVVSFVYEAIDAVGLTSNATVTLVVTEVNDDPTAVEDTYSLDEGATFESPATGVLINDADVEGDDLTVTIAKNVSHGELTLHPDGSFTYLHDGSESTSDQFDYLVDDGNGGTATATVTFSLNPVNDLPVATPDTYLIDEGATIRLDAATGLLANDFDVDSNLFSSTLVSSPEHGTLVLNPDGSFQYEHDGSETSEDQFVYEVRDGSGGVSAAHVDISVRPVNDAPQFTSSPTTTLSENQLFAVATTATDPDDDALTYTISGGLDASHFEIASASGELIFRNAPNFESPADSNQDNQYEVEVMVADRETTTRQRHTITIADVNESPIATDDVFEISEDNRLAIRGLGVLTNDGDEDNDTLTNALVGDTSQGRLVTQAGGEVVWNRDGTFTYKPAVNFNGTDSFVYELSDGEYQDFATVIIHVAPVNDAPHLTTDATSSLSLDIANTRLSGFQPVGNNQILAGNLAAFGMDVDSDRLTTNLVQGPDHGNVTIRPDGSFVFTPDVNFTGFEEFQFEFTDGQLTSEAITAVIEVTPEVGGSIGNGSGTNTSEGVGANGGDDGDDDLDATTILLPNSHITPNTGNDEEDSVSSIFDFINRNDRDFVDITPHILDNTIREVEVPVVPFSVFYASAEGGFQSGGIIDGDSLQNSSRASRGESTAALPRLLLHGGAFGHRLDALTDRVKLDFRFESNLVGATMATTGGVSVGYVLWSIRGGYLIGSLLSSQMPAWKMIDPLPILSFLGDDEDDNSLETIIATARN